MLREAPGPAWVFMFMLQALFSLNADVVEHGRLELVQNFTFYFDHVTRQLTALVNPVPTDYLGLFAQTKVRSNPAQTLFSSFSLVPNSETTNVLN